MHPDKARQARSLFAEFENFHFGRSEFPGHSCQIAGHAQRGPPQGIIVVQVGGGLSGHKFEQQIEAIGATTIKRAGAGHFDDAFFKGMDSTCREREVTHLNNCEGFEAVSAAGTAGARRTIESRERTGGPAHFK